MTGRDISILLLGDPHGGSACGLTPPTWQYNMRGQKDLDTLARKRRQLFATVQRVLWDGYDRILGEFGPVDLAIANADLVDGVHFETIEHITTDVEQQADITKESLSRVKFRGRPDWRFTYGTPVHTVDGENIEHRIAEHFGADIADTVKLRINGCNLKVRHHGGRSDIPTGHGAQLSKEVVRDIVRASLYKFPEADVIAHSHVHYFYHLAFGEKQAFALPSLEVPLGIYGRKLRTLLYDMGLVKMTVDRHGNLDYHKRLIPLNLVLDEEYTEWQPQEKARQSA